MNQKSVEKMVRLRDKKVQEVSVQDALPVRERLIAVAEQLFAEHGYPSVGIRAITKAAGVNLGALHYYFESKEALIEAIFERRIRPIVVERLRLLDECKEDGKTPLLEQILLSFLRPGLIGGVERPEDRVIFAKLRARFPAEADAVATRILREAFDESSKKYIEALARALPELPQIEVYWRFHFLLGIHLYTVANGGRIRDLSNGAVDPADVEQALHHMVPFIAAGFRSPAVSPGA